MIKAIICFMVWWTNESETVLFSAKAISGTFNISNADAVQAGNDSVGCMYAPQRKTFRKTGLYSVAAPCLLVLNL